MDGSTGSPLATLGAEGREGSDASSWYWKLMAGMLFPHPTAMITSDASIM